MKNLEMINLNEEMRLLDLGEYGEEITNYSGSSCIEDCIREIADNNTSICYCDIMEFIKNHTEEFNESVEVNGWQGDIYKQGQLTEYDFIQGELYNHLEEMIKYYAYSYIVNELGFDEITEDDFDKLNDRLENEIDDNDLLMNIETIVDDVLDKDEEDEEEEE